MRIELTWVEEIPVLAARGTMRSEPEAELLEERIRGLISNGCRHVVLDIARLRRVGAVGVGALRRCFHRLRDAGGELTLVGVTRRVRSTLALSGLLRLFAVHDSAETASRSFDRHRPFEAARRYGAFVRRPVRQQGDDFP